MHRICTPHFTSSGKKKKKHNKITGFVLLQAVTVGSNQIKIVGGEKDAS